MYCENDENENSETASPDFLPHVSVKQHGRISGDAERH